MRLKKRIPASVLSVFLALALVLALVFTGCMYTSSLTGRTADEQPVPTEKAVQQTPGTGTAQVSGLLRAHFIDVGQADCILVQAGEASMLIDAGNNDDSDTIIRYLGNLGITRLDYVVGTHPHEDHIGSMDKVIEHFDIGSVILPKVTASTKTFEDMVKAIRNKGLKVTAPTVGTKLALGEAEALILAPGSSVYEDTNNYSVVLKVTYGSTSFLFEGDAEEASEKEMLESGLDLKADVLKVAHHGSGSSSTDEFLDAVSPATAVISVGKDNDYGHPAKQTLERLASRNIKVIRTDKSGSIIATSDGKTITFSEGP